VDFQQNGPAFMAESQGTLRVYFDPHAKRDFTKPDSFRSGEEIAAYDLRRQVLFDPHEGTLYDRSFASCLSSKSFAFAGKEVNLLRLWGSQLILRARAHASNGLPSPLPDYSGAIPYTGGLFVGGERTDLRLSPFERAETFASVWRRDSSAREKNWGSGAALLQTAPPLQPFCQDADRFHLTHCVQHHHSGIRRALHGTR
jgi:hypothetical protein